MSRPRLLFIAPAMPAAGGNGLAMRQGQFLAAYAPHFAIDLAVIPLAGPVNADPSFASRHTVRLRIFPLIDADPRLALLRHVPSLPVRRALFEAYGKPSIQAGLTSSLHAALADWIAGQDYHLIHIGRLYMLPATPDRAVPCLVDADEDDARVLTQFARLAGAAEPAAWARIEALNAARNAKSLAPRAAHIFAASAEDALALQSYGPPVTVIPNAVPRCIPPPRHPRHRILFVGNLAYQPNQAGVAWFLKHCWPTLRRSMPAARFDIIGSGGTLRTQNGALSHGHVRNLAPFYQRAACVIVPVLAGGGSRIKLLEAAGHRVPIVATRIGAQGSHLRPGRDFLAVDDPIAFCKSVQKAYVSPRLGANAARAAAQSHDASRIRARIAAIALSLALWKESHRHQHQGDTS